MSLISRFAVVSIVGIAVLLAILYEISSSRFEDNDGTTEAPPVVEQEPVENDVKPEVTIDEQKIRVPDRLVTDEPEDISGDRVVEKPPVEKKQEEEEMTAKVDREDNGQKGEEETEEERFYPVRKGDTLYSIAKMVYGDGKLWTEIWKANREVIGRPDALSAGVKLRLPCLKEKGVKEETYIVQRGDTLSRISRLHYGTSKFVNLIFKANRDRIREPDRLRVGMVLKIPPLPESKER